MVGGSRPALRRRGDCAARTSVQALRPFDPGGNTMRPLILLEVAYLVTDRCLFIGTTATAVPLTTSVG